MAFSNIWRAITLGECVTTKKGFAFKSGWYTNDGHAIVKVSDFTADSVDATALTRIQPELANDYKTYSLTTGDVVVQTVGSWPSNPQSVVGKAIRVPVAVNGALLNQNAVRVDPAPILDRGFLFYLLRCDHFKSFIINTAQGAASQAAITLDSLRAYQFSLPPIPTQRKIAGLLSAYDDLIENNTRRITILEEMAQAIYREWFVNFRIPGHDKVKLINSPLGKIPEGWKPNRLGDLAKEVRRGVDPSQVDPETPYIGLEHLPRRSITLGEWGTAKDVQSTKLAFKMGEILFGKIRPYFHKVGVAPVDGVCSSDAIVIVPNSPAAFGPVVCCVSSDDFVSHATQTSQGTKMPRANWEVLVKYPLPLPPDHLLSQFNDTIADVVANLRLLMLKNRNLRATRDLLLPKLISGHLDVEELDIEIGEPLVEAGA